MVPVLIGRIVFWLSWPLSYVVIRLSWRTRLLITSSQEVLVVKAWISSGGWGLPGGGLHKGELPQDGVLRETREEVGIILLSKDLIELGEYRYSQYGLPFRCHLYATQLAAHPQIRRQRLEIADSAWLTLKQLQKQNVQPDVTEAIRRLAEQG